MQKLEIKGGKKISGTITISGSKNATLPILASTILTKKKIIITNVPIVKDVENMLELTHRLQIYEARSKNISNWHTEPWMGMVRVSFGLYNTKEDVNQFIYAIKDIISRHDHYAKHYSINDKGDYEHKAFQFSCNEYFSLSQSVQNELDI